MRKTYGVIALPKHRMTTKVDQPIRSRHRLEPLPFAA